jgi:molybdenum cofactor biosynthesis enzyme MoaA
MSLSYKTYEPEDNIFNNLIIDITHRCNMNCANCYIPNRDIPDLDLTGFYDLLKRLPFKTFIRLIGAEPTMRKDLCEIITNVKKHKHHAIIVTNGLKLSVPKYVKSLKNAGLSMVYLSMNGAADPEVYRVLDGGAEYAQMKVQALENIMKENMIVNTGTIIAKGINEFSMRDQVELVRKTMKNTSYRHRLKPLLRIKSVGQIGRYMEDSTYTIEELEELLFDYVGLAEKQSNIYHGGQATTENWYEYDDIYVRLTDWKVDENGVPDSNSDLRGRITPEWKTAPFFEHVKDNEFGY